MLVIRGCLLLPLLFLPLGLAGCSGGAAKEGIVEGTVTIDGSPANSGEVVFNGTDKSIRGAIQANGTYRAIGVPLGPVKVTVNSAPGGTTTAPLTEGMPGSAAVKPIPIPKKYSNVGTSGLSTTVESGTNTYPIPLVTK